MPGGEDRPILRQTIRSPSGICSRVRTVSRPLEDENGGVRLRLWSLRASIKRTKLGAAELGAAEAESV